MYWYSRYDINTLRHQWSVWSRNVPPDGSVPCPQTPPLDRILSKFSTVNILAPCVLKILFNVIHICFHLPNSLSVLPYVTSVGPCAKHLQTSNMKRFLLFQPTWTLTFRIRKDLANSPEQQFNTINVCETVPARPSDITLMWELSYPAQLPVKYRVFTVKRY